MSGSTADLRHISFEGKPGTLPPRPSLSGSKKKASRGHVAGTADEPMNEFVSWVLSTAGLDPGSYRTQPLHRRVPACLRALKASSPLVARMLLEHRPHLLAKAVSSLLIGVTEFFRDPFVFESIRTHVLPELAFKERRLRIWSAACSSGEELYSMAILLSEARMLDGSVLLGTDCRSDAVEQAREGLFTSEALSFLDPALRHTYFRPCMKVYRPIESLRTRIAWKVSDVLNGPEQGPWDIILWRNVSIYLKSAVSAEVWRAFARELAPGGILVTGKAERPPTELYSTGPSRCIYHLKESMR